MVELLLLASRTYNMLQHLVNFSVPSKIDYISPSVTVNLDSDVHLSCLASGTPTPTVKWMYKNTVLHQSSSQANYTVKVTDISQAGQYVCTASNKYGTVSMTTEVVLRRKFTGVFIDGCVNYTQIMFYNHFYERSQRTFVYNVTSIKLKHTTSVHITLDDVQ